MTDLKDIVGQIDLLEPIPPVAARIMTLAQDPDSATSEIADLILNDPAKWDQAALLKVRDSRARERMTTPKLPGNYSPVSA